MMIAAYRTCALAQEVAREFIGDSLTRLVRAGLFPALLQGFPRPVLTVVRYEVVSQIALAVSYCVRDTLIELLSVALGVVSLHAHRRVAAARFRSRSLGSNVPLASELARPLRRHEATANAICTQPIMGEAHGHAIANVREPTEVDSKQRVARNVRVGVDPASESDGIGLDVAPT